jgi:hypothetical protein
MDGETRIKLADKLKEAIKIIKDVTHRLQEDPTASKAERQLGRDLAMTHISALGASQIALRNSK